MAFVDHPYICLLLLGILFKNVWKLCGFVAVSPGSVNSTFLSLPHGYTIFLKDGRFLNICIYILDSRGQVALLLIVPTGAFMLTFKVVTFPPK